jgi:cytidine deaminase
MKTVMKEKKKNNKYHDLIKLAAEARKRAYAPYSKLQVGAALVTTKGNIYSGCNVENASFGLTSCAERNAIFRAIAEEGPGMKIKTIAISANSTLAIPPCGACRQVIAEFRNKGKAGTTILFKTNKGRVRRKMEDLLPDSFEFRK